MGKPDRKYKRLKRGGGQTGEYLATQLSSVIVTLWLMVSQSISLWGSWPDICYCLTVMVLFLWGALSDERTGLSLVYAAGPCQHSLSQVQVPWYSQPFLLSQIWDFLFCCLLWLAESRWRYSTPPPRVFQLSSRHSHLVTDSQSVSQSWCQAQSGAHD
jgi:hypothetical protein